MNLKDEVIEFDVDGTLSLIGYFTLSQACLFGVDRYVVVIATSFSSKGPFPWSCFIYSGTLVTGSSALSSTMSHLWETYDSDIEISWRWLQFLLLLFQETRSFLNS